MCRSILKKHGGKMLHKQSYAKLHRRIEKDLLQLIPGEPKSVSYIFYFLVVFMVCSHQNKCFGQTKTHRKPGDTRMTIPSLGKNQGFSLPILNHIYIYTYIMTIPIPCVLGFFLPSLKLTGISHPEKWCLGRRSGFVLGQFGPFRNFQGPKSPSLTLQQRQDVLPRSAPFLLRNIWAFVWMKGIPRAMMFKVGFDFYQAHLP